MHAMMQAGKSLRRPFLAAQSSLYPYSRPLELRRALDLLGSGASGPYEFEPGTCIFNRGSAARRVWLLRSGTARLIHRGPVAMGSGYMSLYPDTLAGLTECLAGTTYKSRLVAQTYCRFYAVSRTKLIRAVEVDVELRVKLLEILSSELVSANRRVSNSTLVIPITYPPKHLG